MARLTQRAHGHDAESEWPMAMVSCPKCGFTQPADQYCASCGIDMKAWRPREKPFFTRLVSSPVFQIVVVTLVVSVTFVYMRETRRRELAARVRAIEIARQAEEVEQEIQEAQAPRPRVTSNASTAAPPPPQPVAQARTQGVAAAPQPQPAPQGTETSASSNYAATSGADRIKQRFGLRDSSAGTGTQAAATASAPTSVQITFYEMDRNLAVTLMQNATQSTGEGTLSLGVVGTIETRLKQQPARSLDSASQTLQVNQPALIFKGARDQATGANVGFTLQINPVALDEAGAHVQIDLQRILRDSGPAGLDEANFGPQETFVIPKGGALVVVGLLPRKTPTDTEANFYRNVGVLRPLTSPSFTQGQSEAVLVIEAK